MGDGDACTRRCLRRGVGRGDRRASRTRSRATRVGLRGCAAHVLRQRGLVVARQVPISITFDGITFDEGYRADLIVQNLVLVGLDEQDRGRVAEGPGRARTPPAPITPDVQIYRIRRTRTRRHGRCTGQPCRPPTGAIRPRSCTCWQKLTPSGGRKGRWLRRRRCPTMRPSATRTRSQRTLAGYPLEK